MTIPGKQNRVNQGMDVETSMFRKHQSMQWNYSSVLTVDDKSDCPMLTKCDYYAMQDNFFPVKYEKAIKASDQGSDLGISSLQREHHINMIKHGLMDVDELMQMPEH